MERKPSFKKLYTCGCGGGGGWGRGDEDGGGSVALGND